MIGSFFISEKISPSELSKMADLSEKEINGVLERKLKNADDKIDEAIDTAIDDSIHKVERSLDRETNEKIMAINSYSDTVMDDMNKSHDEIMFLYSMLNDRHAELTEMSGKLQDLLKRMDDVHEKQEIVERVEEQAKEKLKQAGREILADDMEEDNKESGKEDDFAETCEEQINHNNNILTLFNEGKTTIEIAKQLGLGVGEVKLVLDLYKGERD